MNRAKNRENEVEFGNRMRMLWSRGGKVEQGESFNVSAVVFTL